MKPIQLDKTPFCPMCGTQLSHDYSPSYLCPSCKEEIGLPSYGMEAYCQQIHDHFAESDKTLYFVETDVTEYPATICRLTKEDYEIEDPNEELLDFNSVDEAIEEAKKLAERNFGTYIEFSDEDEDEDTDEEMECSFCDDYHEEYNGITYHTCGNYGTSCCRKC